MPVALIIAFAASLGVHALALFGPEFDLSNAAEPTPLEMCIRDRVHIDIDRRWIDFQEQAVGRISAPVQQILISRA